MKGFQNFYREMISIEERLIAYFSKIKGRNMAIVQIYVHYIFFGSTVNTLCNEIPKLISTEFKIRMMGELNFFRLKVKQVGHRIMMGE